MSRISDDSLKSLLSMLRTGVSLNAIDAREVVKELISLRAQVKALGDENEIMKKALRDISDSQMRTGWGGVKYKSNTDPEKIADKTLGIVERKGE